LIGFVFADEQKSPILQTHNSRHITIYNSHELRNGDHHLVVLALVALAMIEGNVILYMSTDNAYLKRGR